MQDDPCVGPFAILLELRDANDPNSNNAPCASLGTLYSPPPMPRRAQPQTRITIGAGGLLCNEADEEEGNQDANVQGGGPIPVPPPPPIGGGGGKKAAQRLQELLDTHPWWRFEDVFSLALEGKTPGNIAKYRSDRPLGVPIKFGVWRSLEMGEAVPGYTYDMWPHRGAAPVGSDFYENMEVATLQAPEINFILDGIIWRTDADVRNWDGVTAYELDQILLLDKTGTLEGKLHFYHVNGTEVDAATQQAFIAKWKRVGRTPLTRPW